MRDKSDHFSWLGRLGPGLLYAGAAVGVSHLVQSTKAGAGFGFSLVWVVVLANLIKYPFFEAGPRYAAATGESLIEGYRRIGWFPLAVFILFTLGTMFVVQAAVTIVTAGLAQYSIEGMGIDTIKIGLFDLGIPLWGKVWNPEKQGWVISGWQLSARLLGVCLVLLAIGRYRLLDKVMKVIVLLLTVTTITAVVAAFFADFPKDVSAMHPFDWGDTSAIVAVIIPLVGWMPAPIDIAIWHSVWTLEKKKQHGGKLSVSDALFDFKMGFWGTTVLAVFFVALGALIIFGSGRSLAEITQMQAGAFARMLIDMYTAVLGQWARPVIALAAFTTMLSTTLTCLDAFPRVLQRSSELFLRKTTSEKRGSRIYAFWIILVATGATGLLAGVSGQSMAIMVDFATTLSFVTAPVLATFNFIAVTGKHIGPQLRPATWMRRFSFFGLVFLYGFALYFLWFRFCA